MADYTIKNEPEDFIVKEKNTVKPANSLKKGSAGNYSYYALKKRDFTTMRVLQRIAEFLKIPLKDIGFAGTKDKRAITEQIISIRDARGDAESRLKSFDSKDIELKFIGKGDSPISLGDLDGNEFEIIVRDAENDPKKIRKFINYFGEQRFSSNNAEGGRAIIKADFKRASELIEDPLVKDFLDKNPGNHVGAIKTLPKKILTLYIHAYQSFIWNRTAEMFIKKYMKGKGMSKIKNFKVPVVGFGTELKNDGLGKIVKLILKEEKVSERDFILRQMPDLSQEGTERYLLCEVKGLKIKKLNSKTYKLNFFLPKGCYATELIRQMFG
ncbi:MAG: tRNA pseudouridine(13) synthase TruD [Candidatus Woesearchaeota archaeon]|nr:tRNA pseudouridine(13) synthase TruD [Candidatus Woesearchaeota archaeon]